MNKIFEKGGKFYWLHSTVDAFETFLHVPGTVTRKGAHVRDAIDLKRILILVVIAAAPAALFGMWNVGYQHGLAIGDTSLNILGNFWYGFLKVLPLYLVSYIVGLGIEFASCQIRGEEVSEGYLVSGFFIPLIVPVDIPLWMLALAVAFAVIFGKEVFGGTGMNIVNPAILLPELYVRLRLLDRLQAHREAGRRLHGSHPARAGRRFRPVRHRFLGPVHRYGPRLRG